MRKRFPFAFFLPLLLASGGCGNKISQTLADGGPGDDDSFDAGSDGGCGPAPTIECELPCGGGSVGAQCVNGTWQCAEYGGVNCPPPPSDAGVDACSEFVGGCSGDTYCTGVYQVPTCAFGVWSCEWVGQCEDGGEPDASYPDASYPDASQTLFACGDQACDPSASYCQITTGGPVNPDGGASSGYWCEPLPTSCAPGTQATCDCVTAFQGVSPACSCIGQNGDVIMTCDYP